MTRAGRNVATLFSPWPLAILSVCFGVGIVASSFAVSVSLWEWLAAAVLFAAASGIFRSRRFATILICTAFFFAGAFSFAASRGNVAPDRIKALIGSHTLPTYGIVELTGVISGPVEVTQFGRRFLLAANSVSSKGIERPASGIVRVSITEKNAAADGLAYGSVIRFTCVLEREDEFRAPGVLSDVERSDLTGIDAAARVKSSLLIEHLGEESVFLPLAFVYRQRAAAVEGFRAHLSPSTAGVMAASLLGDRSLLDKQTADVYREGGTFHVLVISGLHITFIAGVLLLIVRFFTRRRWLHYALTIGPLWIYTFAVGADLPIVRAAVMLTACLFGYAMYRTRSVANQLAFAAICLLAWRPTGLFDPSFQLTLTAAAAIGLFALPILSKLKAIGSWTPSAAEPFPPNVPRRLRRFCETLYWNATAWERQDSSDLWTANIERSPFFKKRIRGGVQRAAGYVFEGVLVSLAVQFAMLPLSVIYFHRISIGAIFSNLWVGFFLAVESFAAVFGLFLSAINDTLARPLFALAEACNSLNLVVPEGLSKFAFFSFRLPEYSGTGAAVYFVYAALMILFAFAAARWNAFAIIRDRALEKGIVAAACGLVLLTAVIALHPFSAPAATGRLRVDVIDVGQGDSIFITFPNGETMLVDGGGRHLRYPDEKSEEDFQPDTASIGERVVSPVLWHKGYSRIDYLAASHADIDHTGGLVDVASNFAVGKAFFGRMPPDDPELNELMSVLAKREIPIEALTRGRVLDIGGVHVEILYPAGDPAGPSDNDHSLVLRLVFGNRKILLTGDIERTAEQELLSSGTQLSADVVKVAHHGSRTSSTADFIAATRAAWAIISVGRHSQFGHPHKEVLEAWDNSGAAVLTTGEYGMITIVTDGRELDVSSFTTPDASP